MPWRLLGFIILFAFFLVFIGFNLENYCTISFGFVKFEHVPVYLAAFASFVFGMLCTIPFAISFKYKKKQKAAKANESAPPAMMDVPSLEQKKPGKKTKNAVPEINPNDYGID